MTAIVALVWFVGVLVLAATAAVVMGRYKIDTEDLDDPMLWAVLLLWPLGVPTVLVWHIVQRIFRVMVRIWYWLYDRSTPKAADTHEPGHGEHYRDNGVDKT